MLRLHTTADATARRARIAELAELVGPGVSFLLISHDLAVVRQLTDEAIVMRHGRVVERGATATILDDPQDAYTRQLRASVPGPGWKPVRRRDLAAATITPMPEDDRR